jgi:hypothetical protein
MGIKLLTGGPQKSLIKVLVIALLTFGVLWYWKNHAKTAPKASVLGNSIHLPGQVKGVDSIFNNLIDKTQSLVGSPVVKSASSSGSVLGTATQVVQQIVQKPASAVSDFVIDKTVSGVISQIDKLPKPQQEEIKKKICE